MIPQRAQEVLNERFGHDCLIALATIEGEWPSVRTVNAYYHEGAFYVVTYAKSSKIRQLAQKPQAAVNGEWFTGHAIGENLGHVKAEENRAIMALVRAAFADWYGNGHVNEEDPDTVLLRLRLTDGVLMVHGERFDLVF